MVEFDSNELYITSDFHFGHSNICEGTSRWTNKSGCRPFAYPEEMNRVIIENINHIVPKDATLLHLGDFIFGDKKKAEEFRKEINCKKIIHLFGNHDGWMRESPVKYQLFSRTADYLEFSIRFPNRLQKCVAFHYPILSWNGVNRESWMLHGHCHGNLSVKYGKMIDVGLETNDYKPYTCEQLRTILDKIPTYNIDNIN